MEAGKEITIQWFDDNEWIDIAEVTGIEVNIQPNISWDEKWLIAYHGRMYAETFKN